MFIDIFMPKFKIRRFNLNVFLVTFYIILEAGSSVVDVTIIPADNSS